MQLYYAPETIAVAAALALHEMDVAHELIRVDFAAGEQTKPAYLEINPKGRVPALVTGGQILTETGAILEYLAAQFGKMLPEKPLDAARMRSVMYYIATTVHVNHAHKLRGHRWADLAESHADMTAKVPQTMTMCAQHLETHCLTGPFILGDTVTIGDCYLYAVCRWLAGDGVDMTPFPKINAFLEAMNARPSVLTIRTIGVIS